MRIWTIQNEAAWDYLQENGVLRARREHQDESWPDAYAWIEDQLTKRVGPPPLPDAAPLWAWYHWSGKKKKRPDLRYFRHHWHPPGPYVLIECELPDKAVMLSDSHAWNIILNEGYVSISDEDEEEYWDARRQYDASPNKNLATQLRQRFYKSWERIIDMEVLTEPGHHAMEKKSIQACFWELKQEQVISSRSFISTSKWPN